MGQTAIGHLTDDAANIDFSPKRTGQTWRVHRSERRPSPVAVTIRSASFSARFHNKCNKMVAYRFGLR
jgi:hypothetical protein